MSLLLKLAKEIKADYAILDKNTPLLLDLLNSGLSYYDKEDIIIKFND
ncbi:MAG: hypothetical protein WCS88_00280 [Patescibacteria group bacterium]|jgi:hypothetical protein